MTRFLAIGLAAAFGLLVGGTLAASRTRTVAPSSGYRAEASIPAVSAAPAESSRSVKVQLAADVEIEGKRFWIYVGQSEGDGSDALPVFSIAVPSDD